MQVPYVAALLMGAGALVGAGLLGGLVHLGDRRVLLRISFFLMALTVFSFRFANDIHVVLVRMQASVCGCRRASCQGILALAGLITAVIVGLLYVYTPEVRLSCRGTLC